MARTCLSLLLGLVVVTLSVVPGASQMASDSQALIGTWSGKWSGIWGGGSQTRSGDYVLKITKTEGDKVFGEVEWTAAGTQRTPFAGTFDGHRLTYGTTELVLDGTRLSGKRTGVPN